MKVWTTWLKKSLPWLLLILIWQILSEFLPQVPAATRIFALVLENLSNETFQSALLGSLKRMLLGYAIVCGLGIALGMILAHVKPLDDLLGTLAVVLHAMPGAAWVPLAILIMGANEWAVIFTILLGGTGVVMVNTSSGIKDVQPLILRAARTMGAKGPMMFLHVVLPAAVPKIIDGLRLAWAFSWRALMAGELLVNTVHGMGRLLNQVAQAKALDQLLAFMVIIALIGLLVDHLIFKRMEDEVRMRWGTA